MRPEDDQALSPAARLVVNQVLEQTNGRMVPALDVDEVESLEGIEVRIQYELPPPLDREKCHGCRGSAWMDVQGRRVCRICHPPRTP